MKRAAALILLPLLASCVAAPTRVQPDIGVSPPDRWSTEVTSGDVAAIDWWSGFNDPTLEEVVALALEHNRDLQVAAARLERAGAQARIAGAELKPNVSVGVSGDRQRQNFAGSAFAEAPGVPSAITSTRVGASVNATWEADLWGRLRAGARAGLAEMQAAQADLNGARLALTGQVAKNWFAVAEARQQLLLARESADSFAAVADQIRDRYARGLRPAVELRLAASNQASAEALAELREEQLGRAIRNLEVLLGQYPAGTLLERHPTAGLPDLPAPVPAGLPAEVISRRPDLAAAERRLAASEQRLLVARRSLYPRLSLTASGGTASDELRDLLDGDARVWRLVGNLVQPLFQGGRLRAGVDSAEAGTREALALYAGSALRAYSEVESALAAELHLARRESHLAEAAHQLAAARRLAEDRYREGLGGYLAVLESQTRSLTAESQLLGVRRNLLDNRIDLHLALGGGFELPSAIAAATAEDRAL